MIVAVSRPDLPSPSDSVDLSSLTPVTDTWVAETVTWHVAVYPPSEVVTVMVAVPALTPVTLPEESTVATDVFEDDHVTALLVAFEGFTVAVSVVEPPTPTLAADLLSVTPVTATEPAVTVTVQDPYFPLPSVAVALMVAVPALTPVTTPDELTTATDVSEDDQATAGLEASEGLTVAVSVELFPA